MLKYSVVIPAHNAEKYLPLALESVRAQRLSPEAVIVVNDGSSDATAEIAASYDAVVITHRIARGPSAARNAGVAACSTELVAFLDADDEWTPEHAEKTVGVHNYPGVIFSASRAVCIGSESFAVPSPDIGEEPLDLREMLVLENPIIQSGVVIRRDIFEQAGRYNESMRFAEYYDLWNRVAELGLFCPVVTACVRRRIHDDQVSLRFTPKMVAGAWQVRRTTAARRFPSLSESAHRDLVQLLCEGARRDIASAVWTGEAALLSLVRDEMERTDADLQLNGALAAVGGDSMSVMRLAQDIRCRAYKIRSRLRSWRGRSVL